LSSERQEAIEPQVVVDQQWALFNAERRQWLLARVVSLDSQSASLKYDPGYGIQPPDDVRTVDVSSLLTTPMQFRLAK
jgi:hypothetical protein